MEILYKKMYNKSMKKKLDRMVVPKIVKTCDKELLGAYCDNLMEHFDSVVIIITKHDSAKNETSINWSAQGNHYANENAARTYANANISPNNNDDEKWKT